MNYESERLDYVFSSSKLNLLIDCPRCFWLAINKNLKRPTGPMSSIPIRMDSIIKGYFNRYRGVQLPPVLHGRIKGRLAVGMPQTLRCSVDSGILLLGRPDDYIELEDTNIVVLDNKTASKVSQVVHRSYQLQMDVYSYLLMRNGYKTIPKAYLAYFCPEDCDLHHGMTMNCSVIEVNTNPQNIEKLIENAIRVLKGPIPSPGQQCSFCRWVEENVRL